MANIEQISIYKFKKSVDTFEKCVKCDEKGNPLVSFLKYETINQNHLEGKFWYFDGASDEKNAQNIPWIAFMNEAMKNKIEIFYANSYPRGLFLYRTKEDASLNFFAITFGLGGDANIDKNKILHDFGIKVAMNICDPEEIKSIQTAKQEAISIQSEKQILSGAGLSVFNIDYNDEFFKRIIGKTKEEYKYISSVTGGEKIQLKFGKDTPLSWKNIANITQNLNELYKSDSYKNTEFKSFDNWSFEKDLEKIDKLNTKLITLINANTLDKISLSPPDFIDIDRYDFKYNKEDDKEYEELNILEFISTIRNGNVSLNLLTTRSIFLKDKVSEQVYPKWKAYQCIVAEIIDDNNICYVLYNGQWRKISNNFRQSVLDYFNSNNVNFDNEFLKNDLKENINIYDPQLNQYREDVFNKVCAKNNDNLFLFDKAKIEISGEKKYEICDILTSNKELIHVKKYKTGASSLSHLFSQARVYSDAIIIDNATRKTMVDFINTNSTKKDSINSGKNIEQFKSFLPLTGRLNERDFTVVLCLLTENNIELTDLPFMTQYEIYKMDDYLKRNRGFNVKYINRKVIMK